jgi:hypothetical protein
MRVRQWLLALVHQFHHPSSVRLMSVFKEQFQLFWHGLMPFREALVLQHLNVCEQVARPIKVSLRIPSPHLMVAPTNAQALFERPSERQIVLRVSMQPCLHLPETLPESGS